MGLRLDWYAFKILVKCLQANEAEKGSCGATT